MDFGSVLNGEEQSIECLLRTDSRGGSKCAFSFLRIFGVNGLTNGLATPGMFGGSSGLYRVKHILFARALFLNAISIPVENLEDGQRLQRGGKVAGHVQRWRQG